MFTRLNERGDLPKSHQIVSLRASQWELAEERKHSVLQVDRTRCFVIEDTVSTSSHRSNAEHGVEELREFRSELRHVERKRHAPRQEPITLSTERDIEASLSFDESRDVVPDVIRDSIQPA